VEIALWHMGHTFRSFEQSEQACIFSEKHHWLYYQFIADEVTPSRKERKIQRVFPSRSIWYLMPTPESKVLRLAPADWTGLHAGEEFNTPA